MSEENFLLKKAAILGLGLIGGSLALALQKTGLIKEIIGLDREKKNINLALTRKAIQRGTTDFLAEIEDIDLLILAVPVGSMLEVVKMLLPHLKEGCIITDVGSTKGKVVREIETILPENIFFIGGHPMAGSEKSGMIAADKNIFQNAVYLFTPTEKTNQKALTIIKQLVSNIGCQIVEMNPEEHDVAVASISHLPHLVGVTLVSLVEKLSKNNNDLLKLAAGGFRDTTRVASSHPVMWRDICLSNRDGILEVIEQFEQVLQETKAMISEQNNQENLLQKLEQAKKVRESIPVCQRRENYGTSYST